LCNSRSCWCSVPLIGWVLSVDYFVIGGGRYPWIINIFHYGLSILYRRGSPFELSLFHRQIVSCFVHCGKHLFRSYYFDSFFVLFDWWRSWICQEELILFLLTYNQPNQQFMITNGPQSFRSFGLSIIFGLVQLLLQERIADLSFQVFRNHQVF
jgi:hypothetical protein